MISNVPTVKDELICEMHKASEIRGLWYFMLVNEGGAPWAARKLC